MKQTLDFGVVGFRLPHKESRSLSIQRIRWIGVAEKLRKKDFKYIDHVVHWWPGLIYDIKADATRS